jgi:hypothetical protein
MAVLVRDGFQVYHTAQVGFDVPQSLAQGLAALVVEGDI